MELDLECVASFLTLVEERHFGRSAVRLHLTSSALTKRIQRLEHQLGIELIERGPAGIAAVTSAGSRFYGHARVLLAEAHAAQRSALEETPRIEVRLGVPGIIGEYPRRRDLVEIADRLRLLIPGTRLHCYGLRFSELTTSLLGGQTDVVWTAASESHPDLEAIPIAKLARIGIVALNHPFVDADSVPVADFAAEAMMYDPTVPDGWMSQWYLGDVRPAREANLVEISPRNTTRVLTDVARGLGVTAAPAILTPLLGTRVHAVRLVDAPPSTFTAVHRRRDRRDAVTALISVMTAVAAVSVNRASV